MVSAGKFRARSSPAAHRLFPSGDDIIEQLERRTLLSANVLSYVPAGAHIVRQLLPFGTTQTLPSSKPGSPASLYIDLNNTVAYVTADPTTTDSSGNYLYSDVPAGNYIARVQRPNLWRLCFLGRKPFTLRRTNHRRIMQHVSSARATVLALAASAGLLTVINVSNGDSALTPTTAPAPVTMTAEQDHQQMMDQLHIQSLRPGVDGMRRSAPNYQNTDEAKANPFPNLPDPLVLDDGTKVTTPQMWWQQRRPQLLEHFDSEMYGRVPANVPPVTWEVTKSTPGKDGAIPTLTKTLVGHVDNSVCPSIKVDIALTLTTPTNVTEPVPVIMEFGFTGFLPGMRRPTTRPGGAMAMPRMNAPIGPTWQHQVLSKGWGYTILAPTSFQADNGAGLTRGIIGLCNLGQPRKPDDWGALRAWAWGASRALDYFETDQSVDAKQVGIEGLSRYGKATVVAMAYEPRLAIAFVGSSGEAGAKLSRRNYGEMVENIASSGEYHWMCGNFLKYAGPLNHGDLPVDAHELIALCAPRPVLISCGSPQVEGTWVDDRGQFMAAVAASPVYELLGKKGLGTTEMPAIGTSLLDGDLAFRQHEGGHTTGPNWPYFIQFASRYLKNPTTQPVQ